MLAVVNNNVTEVQRLIDIAKKLNIDQKMVNIPDNYSRTPLYQASWKGYTNIVSLLINAKANINQANKNGATPLFVASQRNNKDVAQVLL